jgi:hypothetical protein
MRAVAKTKTPIGNAAQVGRAAPGVHKVAGARGLYLHKTATGGSSTYRYRVAGDKKREMGLGPIGVVSLADAGAKAKAHAAKRAAEGGHDPHGGIRFAITPCRSSAAS